MAKSKLQAPGSRAGEGPAGASEEVSRGFFARHWVEFVLVALIGGLLVSTYVSSGAADKANQAQQSQINELTLERDSLDATRVENTQTAISEGLGADVRRVEADRAIIREMMGDALSWSNQEEYDESRKLMVERWGIAADSQFMSTYLPEAPGRIDSDGNQHSYIDIKGLNSALSGVNAEIISANGSKYRYMVEVDNQAKSLDGNATDTRRSIVMLTVDSQGVVSDVTGHAVLSPTRTS